MNEPRDDGGSAFPVGTLPVNRGISKRDYFAAHAPVTVLNGTTLETLAASAYAWADAMLAERAK